MNLILTRNEFRQDGIYGELANDEGHFCVTLEHAYPSGETFAPKIPVGTFQCVRSQHRLHGMTFDFETFEITGVEGHTNLLFHWGNFNKDSEGCVLLGKEVADNGYGHMITLSRTTFEKFMEAQVGVNEFTLVVK